MKKYITPEINTSLYASEAIALNDITITGDFADSSMLAETLGDTQW